MVESARSLNRFKPIPICTAIVQQLWRSTIAVGWLNTAGALNLELQLRASLAQSHVQVFQSHGIVEPSNDASGRYPNEQVGREF